MQNVRSRLVRTAALLAFVAAPGMAIAADQATVPPVDLNAKMQEKLNAKLNSNLGSGELDLDSKLSERVDRKRAETEQQLDNTASTVTNADRSGEFTRDEDSDE
ncbi:MAG TPA: hypothetical protein VKZ99_04520 [Gammaproteobacteria bacterium]|nr:hypothetical protein [Gammaproteobacteria bacterium]